MPEPIWQAPSAELFGKIIFAEGVSIWPQVVMRAESHRIEIGAYTNIQDFTMIHIGGGPTRIGAYCSITHHCTIHGATIGDQCLIGINATLMDGASVGANSIVAGHSIVTEGTQIPANSVVAGVPARVVRSVDSFVANKLNALAYVENARAYARGYHTRWSDPDYHELVATWQQQLVKEHA